MTDRVADLTWRRPKAVLIAIGIFVVVAGILGRGLEEHLKAAGFTDPASESERSTELLRDGLGYDANPGLVVLVRDQDDKRTRHHRARRPQGGQRLVDDLDGVDFVGKRGRSPASARAGRGQDPPRAAARDRRRAARLQPPGRAPRGAVRRARAGACRRDRPRSSRRRRRSSTSSSRKSSRRPPRTSGRKAR